MSKFWKSGKVVVPKTISTRKFDITKITIESEVWMEWYDGDRYKNQWATVIEISAVNPDDKYIEVRFNDNGVTFLYTFEGKFCGGGKKVTSQLFMREK